MREIEIKIAIEDPNWAREKLGRLGAVARFPRSFEENLIYDDQEGRLGQGGQLLRLRSSRGRHLLTFKHPTEKNADGRRYKVRQEHQTEVSDREETAQLLEGLGYSCVYRYQKYRQHYQLNDTVVVIDEVPFGVFVELEGLPAGIDQVARALGFGPDRYITETYYELHCREVGRDPPGDLVFAGQD